MNKREEGYYWVKFAPTTRWEVIEFTHDYDGVWLVGFGKEEAGFMWDSELHEIDERRIVRSEVSQ